MPDEGAKPPRSSYARLLERRKTHHAQIAFYHKGIAEAESIDPHEAEIKRERLTKWISEVRENLERIENTDEHVFCEEFLTENCKHEELFLKAMAILRAALTVKDSETSFFDFTGASNIIKPELRLSNIDVPTFSGNYADWQSFNELFCSLVHTNKNLSDVQKFHYLKKSLTGNASVLIKHLPTIAANYQLGWTILTDRYHNKRALVNNFLDLLTDQPKLAQNSAQGVRQLMDITNECLFGIKSLEIATDGWDPWIVHLMGKKLDNESKIAWEQFLGGHKEVPNLEKMMKFLDVRARILDEISKPIVQKPRERVKTAHIETSKSTDRPGECCTYCNGKHFIYFCQTFVPSPPNPGISS